MSPHGTYTRYVAGCRCPECTAASAAYHRAYYRRRHPVVRRRRSQPGPSVTIRVDDDVLAELRRRRLPTDANLQAAVTRIVREAIADDEARS